MCGEHITTVPGHRIVKGSSPRVRGTRACAALAYTSPVDHPRVCGEHLDDKTLYARQQGSSPRVRGTPRPPSNALNPTGIIPACAGNTSRMQSRAQAPRDHPRVCGEHGEDYGFIAGDLGSSPRVRGTLCTVRLDLRIVGIIPACAGNTQSIM